jgi:hypothetical protein
MHVAAQAIDKALHVLIENAAGICCTALADRHDIKYM